MEELNNLGDGILAQINNSKSIEYKPLDKQELFNIFDKVRNTINNEPLIHNIYVNRLSYIMISIIGKTSIKGIQINKLFKWYNLYTRLLTLSNLKAHHISVGYSKISYEDYTKHRQEIINNKKVIENRIYELWEQKKM